MTDEKLQSKGMEIALIALMLFIGFALAVVFIASAEAAYFQDYCINETWMNSKLYGVDNTSGETLVNYDFPIDCSPYTCNQAKGVCNEAVEAIDPFIMIAAVIIITGITFIFAYLLNSAEGGILQAIYLFLTLLFVAADILVGGVIVFNDGMASRYDPLNMLFDFLFIIFMVFVSVMALYMVLSSVTDIGDRIQKWWNK